MAKTKKNLSDDAAKELCQAVSAAMLDKKAQNVVSLNLSSLDGAISTYFVICNADSTTQVDAIANNVEDHVRKTLGQKPRRIEGLENSLWVLLDYVDVIVHVFQTEMRDFYRIEQLWADAGREEHTDEPPVAVKKATVKKKAAAAKTTGAAKKTAAAKPVVKKTTAVKKAAASKTAAKK
jgi:ribosome-associated protein